LKKVLKANVDWRKYISPTNDVLNEYLMNYGDGFLNQILQNIVEAHQSNKPSFVLISFIKTDIVAIVQKNDYKLVLQRLLDLCERLEKYEICSEVVKAQELLNIPRVKKPTKKSRKINTLSKTKHGREHGQNPPKGKNQI
jgi:hypothetical protein